MGSDNIAAGEEARLLESSTISIVGKLTLVKSSLSSLPLYYMSLFALSKIMIEKINIIQRNFLRSGFEGKKSLLLIEWAHIELPKILGGLGVSNLFYRNLALMFK